MKKDFEIKKFNLKKRTIVNILDRSQCFVNGKPAGFNTSSNVCPPTTISTIII